MDGQGTAGYRLSSKLQAVVTPFDPRIGQTIPHARRIEKNGHAYHVVPHRLDETKLLRNFGYAIPSPILSHYDWCNTVPFESQKDTARLMVENPRAFILNDMGTGKTRAALYAIDWLVKTHQAKRALIVAPLSTLATVWDQEAFRCFPHMEAVVLYGDRKKRLKLLAQEAHIYIINHDGLKVIQNELANRADIDIVVLDELALYRNARTQMWKSARAVITGRKFVWGMTGSPTPKAPTDAFAQVKLLTPDKAPKFFKEFQQATMHQISQFKWLPRKEANDVVYRVMQPSVRYTRADCVDLPPTTYTTHEVDMTLPQQRAYKDMANELKLAINSSTFTGTITAANAGVQLSKLIQIGAGFVYAYDGQKKRIQAEYDATPRVKLLRDIITAASGKVIVFAPFVATVDSLHAALSKSSAGLSGAKGVVKIHGGTPKGERDNIFTTFQHSVNPRVLVAHPGTMSHGLTLTAADTIVWYSPVFSLETYEQANARITRPGQNLHTHIIHIQASPVEKRVYTTLQKRGNLQAALLSLFRGV